MLSPTERNEAIKLLSMFHKNKIMNTLYNSEELLYILTNGFAGFATLKDYELIRHLKKAMDHDYSIKQFVDNIVDDLILGDPR